MTVHSKGDTVSISIPRSFHEYLQRIAPRLPLKVTDGRRKESTASILVWLAKKGIEAVRGEMPTLDLYRD